MAEPTKPLPSTQTERAAELQPDIDRMRDYFKAQPKETIKIPKDRGEQFVAVNGYPFRIAAGVEVKVPRQVAKMLRDASVI